MSSGLEYDFITNNTRNGSLSTIRHGIFNHNAFTRNKFRRSRNRHYGKIRNRHCRRSWDFVDTDIGTDSFCIGNASIFYLLHIHARLTVIVSLWRKISISRIDTRRTGAYPEIAVVRIHKERIAPDVAVRTTFRIRLSAITRIIKEYAITKRTTIAALICKR